MWLKLPPELVVGFDYGKMIKGSVSEVSLEDWESPNHPSLYDHWLFMADAAHVGHTPKS